MLIEDYVVRGVDDCLEGPLSASPPGDLGVRDSTGTGTGGFLGAHCETGSEELLRSRAGVLCGPLHPASHC